MRCSRTSNAWAELAEEAVGEVSEEHREITITALEQAGDRLRGLVGGAALAEE